VDAFDLMLMVRWFKRLVGVALVVGFWLAPTPTTAVVWGAIEGKAVQLTERLNNALAPALERKHGGDRGATNETPEP